MPEKKYWYFSQDVVLAIHVILSLASATRWKVSLYMGAMKPPSKFSGWAKKIDGIRANTVTSAQVMFSFLITNA